MKKHYILLFLLGCFYTINAQEIISKKGENYLPETGDWAIGFGTNEVFKYLGNSFNGNVNNAAPKLTDYQGGSFVGKKLISSDKAIRAIANFQYASFKAELSRQNNEFTRLEENTFAIEIGLGKEWRRGKTRLQGFYGADVFVGADSQNSLTTQNDIIIQQQKSTVQYKFGAKGFLGAEYFIFPKIALGAQYNYGVNIKFGGKINLIEDNESATYSTSGLNVGGVGIGTIDLTLYF